jgi:hypothetical protein
MSRQGARRRECFQKGLSASIKPLLGRRLNLYFNLAALLSRVKGKASSRADFWTLLPFRSRPRFPFPAPSRKVPNWCLRARARRREKLEFFPSPPLSSSSGLENEAPPKGGGDGGEATCIKANACRNMRREGVLMPEEGRRSLGPNRPLSVPKPRRIPRAKPAAFRAAAMPIPPSAPLKAPSALPPPRHASTGKSRGPAGAGAAQRHLKDWPSASSRPGAPSRPCSPSRI